MFDLRRRSKLGSVFSSAALIRGGAGLVLVSFLLVVAFGGTYAAQEPAWRVWSDPQFQIPVPADWYPSEAAWVAERVFIATPEPMDPDRLSDPGGVKTDAIIQVKVDALDPELRRIPLDDLAASLLEQYRRLTKSSAEVRFRVLDTRRTSLGGREAVVLYTVQDDMLDYSLITRDDYYLYEVRFAHREAIADRYDGYFPKILEGFRTQLAVSIGETREYTTLLAELELPDAWHVTTFEGESPRVFVTREDLDRTDDRFWTGVTLLKIGDYRRRFGLGASESDRVYEMWLESYLKGLEGKAHRVLGAELVSVGGLPSLLIEVSFQEEDSGKYVQLLNLSTVKESDYYNATFEAPVEEFYRYRPGFLEAVRTLRWR